MHRTCRRAVRIPAGGIVPGRSRARREPDVESVEEDALRVVRIYNNSLIVPVLGIVAYAVLTISQRATLRTAHKGPACAAVSRSPGANLTASGTAAAAIVVSNNGLRLSIDVIRVARRHSNVHPAELIAGININKRRATAGIHGCISRIGTTANRITKDEPISVAGDRGEAWAAA